MRSLFLLDIGGLVNRSPASQRIGIPVASQPKKTCVSSGGVGKREDHLPQTDSGNTLALRICHTGPLGSEAGKDQEY